MAIYQLMGAGVVRGGALIPPDPLNADWIEYQRWLARGNTPDPEPTPPARDEVSFSPVETRALLRVMANAGGKTEAQLRDDFRTAMRQLRN